MKKISKQTMTIQQIVVTAVMIALSIVVIQFVKLPLSATGNVIASGALINLILVIDTLYCGLISGILMSILVPILSYFITSPPVIQAVPLILPCIMVGNFVYILFAWFVKGRKWELNIMPFSLVVGSVAKYFVMSLLIVKWVVPTFGSNLAPKLVTVASTQFSITQLFAALIATFLACIIWPMVKMGLKK